MPGVSFLQLPQRATIGWSMRLSNDGPGTAPMRWAQAVRSFVVSTPHVAPVACLTLMPRAPFGQEAGSLGPERAFQTQLQADPYGGQLRQEVVETNGAAVKQALRAIWWPRR